jgi:drug/metabolite transporter (DMT)-like permease
MSKRVVAIFALLMTTVIWGTTFVATKLALAEMAPFTLALARFLLGSLVLLPLAWAEHRRSGLDLAWHSLALAGLLGGFLYFALQNLALVYTTASKASLITAAVPAFTGLMSSAMLREKMGFGRLFGITASIVGVGVIIASGQGALSEGGETGGDLLMIGSALAWAAYTVHAKAMESRVGPSVAAAASVGFGAIFMIPLAGYEAAIRLPSMPTTAALLAVVYLGLVASAVPFLLWNYALAKVDASEASVYVNLVPVVTVVSAALMLGETVEPTQLLGGALVLGGVWSASKQGQAPQ